MITTQFEDKHIICYFDDAIPVLSHRWKGFVNADYFRDTLLRMIDLYTQLKEQYPTISWLGDTTSLGALSSDAQAWLKDVWPGVMQSAGVKKHALIVPENLFAKIAMDRFVGNLQSSHQGIVIQYFTDELSANEWLKENN
ncbi:MAG: hypothetical protein H7Y07_08075 [Pyrinomonadaceae bacterium]|nr:hypothetical protein [Sphingobacteriaceae bacterium]